MTEISAIFADRHIGPRPDEVARMVQLLGYADVDALVDAAVPDSIRISEPLRLPEPASEVDALTELRQLAARNNVATSMIGQGYYGTFTPSVIVRRLVENPAWYTAYTPYQPEISQGRLEALLNFQTVVSDLTGLPTANASLLDEGTAAAEAMTLAHRSNRKSKSNRFLVDADTFAQTIAVVRTRAEALGIEVVVADTTDGLPQGDFFGFLVQYPGSGGVVRDLKPLIEAAHAQDTLVAVASDLLALTLLEAPGEAGADIVIGSSQRFGVPLFYGGPHAGFMSVRAGLERSLPGRLVGVSVDSDGAPAYRLALQTREQHIRREKATSNICTAQVLLAVVASMYAVYHGPDGLKAIANRVHDYAGKLAASLRAGGVEVVHGDFFDTVLARVPGAAADVVDAARQNGIWLREVDADHVGISCDEKTDVAALTRVCQSFGVQYDDTLAAPAVAVARTSEYLTHPVFNTHRSETSMLRYLRKLSDKDYALDRGMIPLGSCTMKLNATTEMEAVTWPEFADMHPLAPIEDAAGYVKLISQLERWLAEVTGYAKVSIQPNAGSQGELAGLLAIRGYHRAQGNEARNVCLIPSSAHGTNAASAVMAGMKVVVVKGNEDGTIDLGDLRAKAAEHADKLAAIMITYPSTHGVYEESVTEVCRIVHDHGGQVYVDGANLNALLGLAKPGEFGGDVSHLNLHKTFCIPHGGGGPGVGPVAVAAHLAPYLPNHPLLGQAGPESGVGPISAAPFGSAGVLAISWAYIRMMGGEGLTAATKNAVLTANYVAKRLENVFPVLYTGENGLVAHECILDLRPMTKETGISVDDVAKRLVDYGFHAPTMSFPVAGTLMVEPTESEDLGELDRFCDAMIAIRHEIDRVAAAEWPADDNPLVNAPHTAASVINDKWEHAYTREEAAFPQSVDRASKYWPPVRRIDGAYGDRNLICSCPSPEAFE
ncbi:aminomethyl-transferring glycine dehydrogenase [Kribbella sandramycini]|uniref:Glycine dehydrogenase (decarboxylating) n=1 Tax=Kribbella sandramycini TaxID=60450 RepID=A0A7Y4L762_9ACTN|nr:aminomethyl-transferring glycine dehydrogenase [Kribbella sandramycini]MBB6568861.1 glycine dehydrogenase [Kribbella sandramycini]NOL45629.1 aminomethyl-transferring glycine dehydrogenase [Kribbella sandramycini]